MCRICIGQNVITLVEQERPLSLQLQNSSIHISESTYGQLEKYVN